MRKSFLLVVALLLVSMTVVGCGGGSSAPATQSSTQDSSQTSDAQSSSEEKVSVKWILNSKYPDTNHIGETIISFADKVREATEGRVDIEPMLSGALGYAGPENLRIVRDGMVEMSDTLMSEVAGDEPLFGVTTLPFVYRNIDEYQLFTEISMPYYEKAAEEKWNQKILFSIPWPISGFWTQNEIRTLDDMKGLKMRTYDEMGARVLEAVGGTPYPLPFGELYSALATGVVDSVVTSTTTAVDAKFWEVLKYHSPVAVMAGLNVVAVNLDEFNKLDKETQDIIIQIGKEVEADIWSRIADLDKEMQKIANDNGIITIEPSEELIAQLEEVTEKVRQDWLANAPAEAQEILDKFYEAVGR